jgi:hypothetical protein
MDQDDKKLVYDYADKFIELANEMALLDKSGKVGLGIRFAAARYSAYEASMLTKNLAEDKEKQLEFFANDFKKMLQFHIDDYIRIVSQDKSG